MVRVCSKPWKMKTCWCNEHVNEIEDNTPEKYASDRPTLAGCSCGRHSWSTREERRLNALKGLEHHHLGLINQLRKSQWEITEMKPDLKSDTLDGDYKQACKPTAMKQPQEYPIILSPHSLCWWEQPDSVVPPLCTGLVSRYGHRYCLPKVTSGHYKPLTLMPIIQPAKTPTFDIVPWSMRRYWDIHLGRTEYEDSFNFTGWATIIGSKQYAEPIPSCRRRKEIHPF